LLPIANAYAEEGESVQSISERSAVCCLSCVLVIWVTIELKSSTAMCSWDCHASSNCKYFY